MRKAVVVVGLLAGLHSAWAARWTVLENQPDPFDKSRSAFAAGSVEGGALLAVRCIEGRLTFAMTLPPNSADEGEVLRMRIVADDKPPGSGGAARLGSSATETLVQFGDGELAEYLRGARRYAFRFARGEHFATYAFTGGASFDDALTHAEKACGVEPFSADCAKEASCARQFQCAASRGQLGAEPSREGYLAWCARQPGMTP